MAQEKTAKEFLKEHGKKETKIRLNDRMKVKIIKATKHYKLNQVVNPHKLWAEKLIADKTAVKVK